MSNDLTIRENYGALDAAIGAEVDDAQPLRFKDGAFYGGFDKVEVELGTVFRVHPMSVQDGFIKWVDGRPADIRMREWSSGLHPIDRNELDELDKAGESDDPWSYTMYIAFKDAEGTLYKFTASSKGSANAVRKMLRQWRRGRDKHPGLVPVVALGRDSYEHKVHRTTIRVPTFEIMGWEAWDENAPAPAKAADKFSEVLDDEIPF